MRTFFLHPLAAAIVFAVLVTCALCAFLFFPVCCINWGWNSLVAHFLPVPQIVVWQACLLYLALLTSCYLLGLIRIEVRTESED